MPILIAKFTRLGPREAIKDTVSGRVVQATNTVQLDCN